MQKFVDPSTVPEPDSEDERQLFLQLYYTPVYIRITDLPEGMTEEDFCVDFIGCAGSGDDNQLEVAKKIRARRDSRNDLLLRDHDEELQFRRGRAALTFMLGDNKYDNGIHEVRGETWEAMHDTYCRQGRIPTVIALGGNHDHNRHKNFVSQTLNSEREQGVNVCINQVGHTYIGANGKYDPARYHLLHQEKIHDCYYYSEISYEQLSQFHWLFPAQLTVIAVGSKDTYLTEFFMLDTNTYVVDWLNRQNGSDASLQNQSRALEIMLENSRVHRRFCLAHHPFIMTVGKRKYQNDTKLYLDDAQIARLTELGVDTSTYNDALRCIFGSKQYLLSHFQGFYAAHDHSMAAAYDTSSRFQVISGGGGGHLHKQKNFDSGIDLFLKEFGFARLIISRRARVSLRTIIFNISGDEWHYNNLSRAHLYAPMSVRELEAAYLAYRAAVLEAVNEYMATIHAQQEDSKGSSLSATHAIRRKGTGLLKKGLSKVKKSAKVLTDNYHGEGGAARAATVLKLVNLYCLSEPADMQQMVAGIERELEGSGNGNKSLASIYKLKSCDTLGMTLVKACSEAAEKVNALDVIRSNFKSPRGAASPRNSLSRVASRAGSRRGSCADLFPVKPSDVSPRTQVPMSSMSSRTGSSPSLVASSSPGTPLIGRSRQRSASTLLKREGSSGNGYSSLSGSLAVSPNGGSTGNSRSGSGKKIRRPSGMGTRLSLNTLNLSTESIESPPLAGSPRENMPKRVGKSASMRVSGSKPMRYSVPEESFFSGETSGATSPKKTSPKKIPQPAPSRSRTGSISAGNSPRSDSSYPLRITSPRQLSPRGSLQFSGNVQQLSPRGSFPARRNVRHHSGTRDPITPTAGSSPEEDSQSQGSPPQQNGTNNSGGLN